MTTDPQTELTDTQKTYNVAQSDVFQLAAYGHHRYHPSGEALTDEGKRQQRDYNDRIQKAREELEGALLRLVAERAELFRGDWGVVAAWLRSLADDPAEVSLLAVTPEELERAGLAAVQPQPSAAVSPLPAADRAALLDAAVWFEDPDRHAWQWYGHQVAAMLRRLADGERDEQQAQGDGGQPDGEVALLRLTVDAIEEGRRELRSENARLRAQLWMLAAALDGLHTLIATSSRDWGTYRVDAWIWAVLCGWDCEQAEHDETCTHGALEEAAALHGWDDATVAKARRYRAAVRVLTEPTAASATGQPPADTGEEADRIAAYRSRDGRSLYCTRHVGEVFGTTFEPVTSEDLPDGGICTYPECGADVLIPQPTEA